jgi:hypothetical protein
MRKFAILAAACLALTGCAGLGGLPSSPAAVAESTVLDEQGALGVELAYKALRTALELAVDTGALRGEAATRAAALDNRAYGAVFAARAAYRAGNATSYAQAVTDARAAITAALAAIGSKSNV